jgi:hypothetical protein
MNAKNADFSGNGKGADDSEKRDGGHLRAEVFARNSVNF